jgi:hypothetical protein
MAMEMNEHGHKEAPEEREALEVTISERGVSVKAENWQIALSAIVSLTLLGGIYLLGVFKVFE